MAFWNIFKRKEEVAPIEVTPEDTKKEWKECFYCKQIIYEDDRYAKQQGKYFHKNCYKEMIKEFK